jgi:NAD(P)-dependent dehydrogenase (short-subunit alcohol dehydrogenase family)
MTIDTTPVFPRREPELPGQTVVVIEGSSGIGFETARRARGEAAELILTSGNAERLQQAARRLGAVGAAGFDASDPDALRHFFDSLTTAVDHVMVTAGDAVAVARAALGKVKGSMVFVGRRDEDVQIANLALELAPVRVNLVAPIGRVAASADVAALAVHLMSNTAITGATVDIDGAL